MKEQQKEIIELQKFDALSEAERITGRDYKTNDDVSSLGMFLHIQKGELLRKKLQEIGDTQFSSTVKDYLHIATSFGFEVVYTEPFTYQGKDEIMYILFLKELGIILHFDSFTWSKGDEPHVNGGKFYYNWSPNEFPANLTSSGSYYFPIKDTHIGLFEADLITPYTIEDYPSELKWDYHNMEFKEFQKLNDPIVLKQRELFNKAVSEGKRFIWVGDHDCREALLTTITAMCENGIFCPIWHKCQFPWLTNFSEHKDVQGSDFTEFYEKTKDRLSKMPKDVTDCINNTYRE